MKVRKLREVLERIAEMQHRCGDDVTANYLKKLQEILQTSDKDEVSKMVDSIQQRRER